MPRRVAKRPVAQLTADLAGPVTVELTKAVDQIHGPHALPGVYAGVVDPLICPTGSARTPRMSRWTGSAA